MQYNFAVSNSRVVSQKRVLFLFISLLFVLPAQASDATEYKKSLHSKFSKKPKIKTINDLRIIVDISGSMKKTDPHNLRRSAVRLLAGLIPDGSRAGIWNFGKQVNMSVKIGAVNNAWRELARKQSKKINSVGLYTNIESAMRKVSFDWKKADPRYERNIILLTDGHVDVSKDDKLDKASRTRILKEILPQLEKARVRIHTIALSDDVDESLLSTLSAYTDGLYKKVDSADDLQKLFLQMLEQSIKLDTLPIKDNRFSVDASINDMTLLVFNKDKSRPTTIVTSANKKWNKNSHPEQVKWFSDEGYDLITIKKPHKGEWKIQAPTDPNNRVVVATNLKLKLNNIPSYLMLGDALKVTAYLEEDGKPLTDKRLLSKFKFVLNRDAERSSERRYPLTKSEHDEFSYTVQLSPKFKQGNNELVIQAKSPTAEREIRHQFKVYTTPAEITVSESHGKYQVKVSPYFNIMRPESIQVSVELKDKSKHVLIQHEKNWIVDIDQKFKGSVFNINIEAIGADGKPISMNFDKLLSVKSGMQKLDLAAKFEAQHKTEKKHEPEEKHTADPKQQKEVKHTADPKQQKEVKHEPEKNKHGDEDVKDKVSSEHEDENSEKEEEISWVFIISSIVIGNLLLAGIFGGGYIFMKRRKEKLIKDSEEEIGEDIIEKETTSKKNSPPEKEEKEK